MLYKHCNSCYKQLCLSDKMEHLSYKGGCGICEHTCIQTLKEELACAIDKWHKVISNKILVETTIPLRN